MQDLKGLAAISTAIYAGAACTAASVPLIGGTAPMLLLGVLFGMGAGMQSVYDVAIASTFGRKYLGTINGYRVSILNVGAALGPLVVAVGRVSFGYSALFFGLGGILTVATGAVCLVPKPVAPAAPWHERAGEGAALPFRAYGAC